MTHVWYLIIDDGHGGQTLLPLTIHILGVGDVDE